MAVGIALIVFLVSLGFGLQQMIRGQIANVEALTILDVSRGESTLLELNTDVVNNFKNIDNVQDVSPSLSLSGQIINQESLTDVAIYGVDPKFLVLEGIKINIGDSFSNAQANEIIITTTALNLINIASDTDSIGMNLKIKVLVPQKIEGTQEEELVPKEVGIKVVGILTDDDELSLAYVPLGMLTDLGFTPDYSAAKVKVGQKGEDFTLAKVKVTDESKLPEVRRQIESMGYQVDSVADTVGQIDKIFLVFEIVVAGFGAIAMFVAALGSLNTLTVSLLERTREIGLMKALGATSGDILRLFLMEAVVIGLTGGLIGIALGVLSGRLFNFIINLLAKRLGGETVELFYTPLIFIAVIVVIVFIISVITGIYPARRAGKISALDALRYE